MSVLASPSASAPSAPALPQSPRPAPRLVVAFDDIGRGDIGLVGGKGVNLGILAQAGLRVPPGFCLTTHAFAGFVAADPVYHALMDELEHVSSHDLEAARALGARLRAHLAAQPVPAEIHAAAAHAWRALGTDKSYAVRSSATAEDLPSASFAGQQDTYLNVRGEAELIDRIRACWASLYTDRAILYRAQNRIAQREVSLSVIVQVMVRADKAGILFTADPVTGHRHTMAIDAGFGLGESLVSGLVSADLYKLDKRTGRLLSMSVGDKKLAILPGEGSGTVTVDLDQDKRSERVLDDRELAELLALGCRVETLQMSPQDLEWCIAEGTLHVVQARPITSLYPLPEPALPPADESLRVSICFNHLQVMTDAMPPMTISLWQLVMPFGRAPDTAGYSPWSGAAGGRLYIDTSRLLRRKRLGALLIKLLGGADRLIAQSLAQVAARPEIAEGPRVRLWPLLRFLAPRLASMLSCLLVRDPAARVAWASERMDGVVADFRARTAGGAPLAERMRAAHDLLGVLINDLFDIPPLILAGMLAGKLAGRLSRGEDADGADVTALGRGLQGNVTTEMDLAVGDLADAARPYPALSARLVAGDATPGELAKEPGGDAFLAELDRFLDRYGMRAPSEIDLSRPRWRDDPRSILSAVAGNLAHDGAGAHREHHRALAGAAEVATARLLEQARRGLLGPLRARLVRRLIRVHRHLTAVREHPKFALVRVFDVVRGLIIEAGALLHGQGRLAHADDVWMLRIDELARVLDSGQIRVDELVATRKAELERHRHMAPPRVLTSHGESPVVQHDAGAFPAGALVGSPASAGVVEGIARVIRDPAREVLARGEILIAPFTDPGWTPLFINATGLVMEVGGLMTHGSVVAREYGIPAVVCVPDATARIRTGQRIRVHGDRGFVEILGDVADAAAVADVNGAA